MHTQSVSTPDLVVAQGPYAPGHLGELTPLIPFDMVDHALTETRTTQSRVRDLPSRVAVYLLLAACLFPELGYPGVWRKLTTGLTPIPTASALRQARQRLGTAPLWWLFDLLRGPTAPAIRWRGLLVCAIDGTTMTVPDGPANLTAYRKHRSNHGGSATPRSGSPPWWPAAPEALIDCPHGRHRRRRHLHQRPGRRDPAARRGAPDVASRHRQVVHRQADERTSTGHRGDGRAAHRRDDRQGHVRGSQGGPWFSAAGVGHLRHARRAGPRPVLSLVGRDAERAASARTR
ncbi:transposase IS4-like protein [Kutzneria buriramensis]|uniref:Transposase IS4-like protein n=1 Tax=Kutzneria buriramensis TaxID=1045776 RepID=A0A3E0GUP6_9PSEU|nr:transposase IS4-like protein [Kutzneria buriramensis]